MKTTKMSNSNKVDLYCYDIYGTLNYTHLEDYATQHEHIKRLEKNLLSWLLKMFQQLFLVLFEQSNFLLLQFFARKIERNFSLIISYVGVK